MAELLGKPESMQGGEQAFTGDVWYERISGPAIGADLGTQVNLFRCAPGSRTGWHTHSHGQVIYVLDGVAWLKTRDDPRLEVNAGEIVWCPPGEEHWHGASATDFMNYLSVQRTGISDENPGQQAPRQTGGGLPPVSDAEYLGEDE